MGRLVELLAHRTLALGTARPRCKGAAGFPFGDIGDVSLSGGLEQAAELFVTDWTSRTAQIRSATRLGPCRFTTCGPLTAPATCRLRSS